MAAVICAAVMAVVATHGEDSARSKDRTAKQTPVLNYLRRQIVSEVAGAANYNLQTLQDGERRIRAGAARPMSDEAISELLATADVVLVGDVHDLQVCRRTWTRTQGLMRSSGSIIGLGMEALLIESQDQIDECLRNDRSSRLDCLMSMIRVGWRYPVDGYEKALEDADGVRIDVLGLDSNRSPSDSIAPANLNACHAIENWLGSPRNGIDGRRQACILFGQDHMIGRESSLFPLLVGRGYRVTLVVPFSPLWELALREQEGGELLDRWVEVLPGILRSPFVRDEDILCAGQDLRGDSWRRTANPPGMPSDARSRQVQPVVDEVDEARAAEIWGRACNLEREGQAERARRFLELIIDMGPTSYQQKAREKLGRK